MTESTVTHRRYRVAAVAAVLAWAAVGAIPAVDAAKPVTNLAWLTSNHQFGWLTPSNSATFDLVLSNTGTKTVRKPPVTITNTLGAEITITNDSCATTVLAPLGQCTVTLQFAPTAEGPQAASVSVIAGRTTFTATVRGNAGTPVQAAAVDANGYAHACAVTTSGGLKCWGYNLFGQLGDGTTTNRLTAVDVSGLTSNVSAVGVGDMHTCAVISGGVKCWGANYVGQLGDGSITDSLSPISVSDGTSPITGIVDVDGGYEHTCALTTSGGVKCWGSNFNGQLGNGTNSSSNVPVDVTGLASGVAAISIGGNSSCALTTGGGVKCWGSNGAGQLGDGTDVSRNVPGDVTGLTSGVSALESGSGTSCALVSGGATCWGNNVYGEVGNGSSGNRVYTPTSVIDGNGPLSGVTAIAPGLGTTCAIVSGATRCWGGGGSGQLGDGSTTYAATSPVTVIDASGALSGGTAVATGRNISCAITTGGGLKCWGNSFYGALGDGTSDTVRAVAGDVFPFAPSASPAPVSTTSGSTATIATAGVRTVPRHRVARS